MNSIAAACHRVIGNKEYFTGFAGGQVAKNIVLRLESSASSSFCVTEALAPYDCNHTRLARVRLDCVHASGNGSRQQHTNNEHNTHKKNDRIVRRGGCRCRRNHLL